MASFGQINACGGGLDNSLQKMLLSHYSTISLFFIPVMVWKNASVEIPYYQQFLEIPRHQITMSEITNGRGEKFFAPT
jgi:hypothetical protein